MVKVSVVIPVYNVESFIGECVDSVLSQTFCDFELILVDDGSIDKSGCICDEYAKNDTRVKVFHTHNEGVSNARNFGIKHAMGEWICFVDSDDYLDTNHLEYLFNSYKDGDGLLMCGHVNHYVETSTIKVETFSNPCTLSTVEDVIYDSEVNNIINSPVCKLFRRSIIMEHGLSFDSKTSYGEDHLFVLNYCMYVGNISLTTKATYHYVHRGGVSLTNRCTNSDRYVYYFTQLVNTYKKLIKSHGWFILEKKIPKVISGHGVMAVVSIFKDNRTSRVKRMNFNAVYRALNECKSMRVGYPFQKLIVGTFFLPPFISYMLCQMLCALRNISNKKKSKKCIKTISQN